MVKSKTGKTIQRPLSAVRKKAFLAELANHGIAAEAARVASPHSKDRHGCYSSFKAERKRDPKFAGAWDAACEEADARLLREAHRRAVDGVQKGIFQKAQRVMDHDGKPASEAQYSDPLMLALLKARFPNDFIERKAVEHTGQVAHSGHGTLYLTLDDVQALGPEDLGELARILELIELNRDAMIDVTPRQKTIEHLEAQ